MIPIDLDHSEEEPFGLLDFITTNVTEGRSFTRADLERHGELAFPGMFTRQFEVGPEDLFRSTERR